MTDEAAEFYDAFAAHQVEVGINDRNRSIQRWLEHFGLVRGMDVLEIGCGVGTQSELIARRLRGSGTLLATDVSPRSIELARARLAPWPNVDVMTADAVEMELDRDFDVIVLPDVIEHIPLDQHPLLFANIRRWLKDSGWVLVHIPNPLYLEWCHLNHPELLQALDQPVFTEALLRSLQENDLYVHYLETYSIWVPEGDYQVILLKPRRMNSTFHFPEAGSRARGLIVAARNRLGGRIGRRA